MPLLLLLLLIQRALGFVASANNDNTRTRTNNPTGKNGVSPYSSSTHTSNYAVIVSTSRYYFNYRHNVNALSVYRLLKNRGRIPDSNIILMLAHDMTCDARNPFKDAMFSDGAYDDPAANFAPPDDVEVDYRGDEVNIENLVRVLLGRHPPGERESRKLSGMTEFSNVLVFLTGHGGDSFFKFHDLEEISSLDFASVFDQMRVARRYHSLLFIADTCQAFTLSEEITAPNVVSVGSSLRDENSYAHHSDRQLGVSVVDRFSATMMHYLTNRDPRHVSLRDVFQTAMTWSSLRSHAGIRGSVGGRSPAEVSLAEFTENVEHSRVVERTMTSDEGSDLGRFPISSEEITSCATKTKERKETKVKEPPRNQEDAVGDASSDFVLCTMMGFLFLSMYLSAKTFDSLVSDSKK